MVRRELKTVKVQARKGLSNTCIVTIPKPIVTLLGIKQGDRLKVYMDIEKKEIIYKITS